MNNQKKIFYAKNIQEIFYNLKNIKDLQIIGGGTNIKNLPERALSVINIPELKKIIKHERFIDFGPATTLQEILNLGEKHIPKILYESISSIANPFVRNIATLGGNILNQDFYNTLFAPLLALETKLELKTESEVTIQPLSTFKGFKPGQILTNIRVPVSEWDIELFYRLGPESKITENSASFAFLIQSEKNIITSIKIAFAGSFIFKNPEFESKLLGLTLPLTKKTISSILEDSEFYFQKETKELNVMPMIHTQFINLLKFSLEHLL